jgi:hypothetical protein
MTGVREGLREISRIPGGVSCFQTTGAVLPAAVARGVRSTRAELAASSLLKSWGVGPLLLERASEAVATGEAHPCGHLVDVVSRGDELDGAGRGCTGGGGVAPGGCGRAREDSGALLRGVRAEAVGRGGGGRGVYGSRGGGRDAAGRERVRTCLPDSRGLGAGAGCAGGGAVVRAGFVAGVPGGDMVGRPVVPGGKESTSVLERAVSALADAGARMSSSPVVPSCSKVVAPISATTRR